MVHQLPAPNLPALAALIGLALAAPAARADEPRDKAAEAFRRQSDEFRQAQAARGDGDLRPVRVGIDTGAAKDTVDVWAGSAPRITPVPVPGVHGGQPCRLVVKVWAELSTPMGDHTGKFVPIELYRWHPNEFFYFWFQSPVPVQISLVQYYDVGPAEAKRPELVAPHPMFPQTYATVPPGAAAFHPQLFRTDNTPRDEFVTLTIVQAGVPAGPTAPPPAPITIAAGDNANLNLAVINATHQFHQGNAPSSLTIVNNQTGINKHDVQAFRNACERLAPVLPAGANPAAFTSQNPDEVALFALGLNQMGHLPLRFSK